METQEEIYPMPSFPVLNATDLAASSRVVSGGAWLSAYLYDERAGGRASAGAFAMGEICGPAAWGTSCRAGQARAGDDSQLQCLPGREDGWTRLLHRLKRMGQRWLRHLLICRGMRGNAQLRTLTVTG